MKKYSEMTDEEKQAAKEKAKKLGLAEKCVGCAGNFRCYTGGSYYYLCNEYPGTGTYVNKEVGVIVE